MTRRAIQVLLLAAVVVASAWFAVAPSPEPAIAVLMGLVGALSVRLSGGQTSETAVEPKPTIGLRPSRSADHRIAVLPLRPIAGESGQEYIADGLTEELINMLSRVGGLEVIARSSVMRYREGERSVSEIAGELAVGAVLEGSARMAGSQLRVSVRLIDAATESQMWTGDYDREMSEIFAVQRDIARRVADSLEVSILSTESVRLEEVPTTDLEAYDLYLLGRHDLNRRTEEGLLRSIDRFRAAVDRDPEFAAAYAGIADAYVLAVIGYAAIDRAEAMEEAQAASERAIALQGTLPDAHTSRGFVLMNFDWDWPGAEVEFRRAIELNPSEAQAYQWFAQCKSYQGRFEDAIPLVEKARELDPRSPLIATEAGWPFMYLGRDDEAADRFRHALELDPEFALAHFNIGNLRELAGDFNGALEKYERAVAISGGAPVFEAFAARVLALLGRPEQARKRLEDARHKAGDGLSSVYIARVYEALGETDAALHWLERARDQGDPMVVAVRTRWLQMNSLKGMSRYEALLDALPGGESTED